MAHVRHILLLTIDPVTHAPLTADQITAKRKQIDDILKRAQAGEDFAVLATQYSEDPGSKDNGGELPPFGHGEMVPQFEAAAFSMKTNTISGVVTTRLRFSHHQAAGHHAGPKSAVTPNVSSTKSKIICAAKNREAGTGLSGQAEKGSRRGNPGSRPEGGGGSAGGSGVDQCACHRALSGAGGGLPTGLERGIVDAL